MSSIAHVFEVKLDVPPARAFAALAEASELKSWFAEHVEIDPKVGGRFHFWGKHTYGTPTRTQATQQLVRYERPSAIAFTWTMHDEPSTVSLTVEADPNAPNGSIVKGRHEFARAPAIGRAKEMLDDLWRLAMGNLQIHVRGGQPLLPNYADPDPEIRASILIDAPRERVFSALLEPELMNKWIATAAAVEPRIGGRYTYGWKSAGPSRILDMLHNEKLVIDWPDWRGDPNVPAQKVTWLLESVGKQTRVTLVHSGFVRTVDYSDYPHGWRWFLDRLRAVSMERTDGVSERPVVAAEQTL